MKLGDKVVMNRDSEGFKSFTEFMEEMQGDLKNSWWTDLEQMEPLTVVNAKETDDGLELELVDTAYRVMDEWVKKVN